MDFDALYIVRDFIETHLDRSDPIKYFDVYIVWKCKTLQNCKYLISSTIPDGMYYELTYNGNAQEWYLDTYKKIQNIVIPSEIDYYGKK